MAMTKRDFNEIAEIIATVPGVRTRRRLAIRFATNFELDYPSFDAKSFLLTACAESTAEKMAKARPAPNQIGLRVVP